MRILFLAACSLALSLPFAPFAEAVPITTCNQTVTVGDVGVLQNDVVCSPDDLAGIILERDAALDLNGFSLVSGGASNVGVFCLSRECEIRGPGVIDGAPGRWISIWLEGAVKLKIRDVTVRNGDIGITGSLGTAVKAENVTIEDIDQWAFAAGKIRASGLTVTGSAALTIAAVNSRTLSGENIDVSNNGAIGIRADSVRVENLTVNGNAGLGIEALRGIVLRGNSAAFGNDAAGDGIDLQSVRPPRLRGASQCGRSADENGAPWGVCQND